MSNLGRFLCWLGKHRMLPIADWSGGVLYTGIACSRCGLVDDSSIKTTLVNRRARRKVARA